VAEQVPSKELLVFKATPKDYPDSPCHFGDYAAARAWAGDGGTIETVTLRPQPKLVQSAPEPALTLASLRQLAEEYVGTLDKYPIENYATPQEYAGSELSRFFAWLSVSSGFAVRAAQPPGAGG
jgi:hypothetical protein